MLAYLDPAQLGETAELWVALLQLAVSLGTVTATAALGRSLWNVYRWKRFKRSVIEWLRDQVPRSIEHPKLMDEAQWIAKVEDLLAECYFSPFEAQHLIELAVPVAQEIVRSQLI